MIGAELKKLLEKQQYRIVGNHSACKICTWTKKSLRDEDVCYKQQFYGIKSHQCCQMTPSLFCTNSCVFCWRDISMLTSKKFIGKVDEPKEIINGCVEAQRELLNGFLGNPKTNLKKFKEAQNPSFFAISLSGEPTFYPKIGELIEELHKMKKCSFLVTNGQFPQVLTRLNKLPTQLYVSLDAPTKEIYKKIDQPLFKDAWERLNKTLELLPSLDTRVALRITLIKKWNMCNEKEYANLIKKANPMFVEVKAGMAVGYARYRMEYEDMPRHEEVKLFAEKIADCAGMKIIDEKKESRVVLLMKEDFDGRIMKF